MICCYGMLFGVPLACDYLAHLSSRASTAVCCLFDCLLCCYDALHSLPPLLPPSLPSSLPPSLFLFPPLFFTLPLPPTPSPLSQFYRKPLIAISTTSQSIMTERDVNTIFYRTEDLFELHTALHEKLEPQLQNWSVSTCVGAFFMDLVSAKE